MKWRVLLAPPRFWEKRNTVENPRRLVNNSKLEFWYCNCTSPEVFATRYRNTENRRSLGVSGPIALNSRKHKGGRRWRQLFRRRVAAPLPSSCIAATAGETPMRETHKTQTDEIPSCFWEADAGESLLCDACSCQDISCYCLLPQNSTPLWYWMVLVCMEFHKKGGHSNCCRILSYCVCQLFFVPIRWERHVSVLYLPFKQESGGLLLLDEDRTRSVNMLTATSCWTANRMFKSLRWMCLCSGNKCFGCGDWSNHSEGFRHGPSMNFIVWDVFLDSPRCFWLFFSSPFPHFWTHWTHFEEVIRSDFNCTIITIAHRIQTLFLGQIRTDHTVKLQCLKLETNV